MNCIPKFNMASSEITFALYFLKGLCDIWILMKCLFCTALAQFHIPLFNIAKISGFSLFLSINRIAAVWFIYGIPFLVIHLPTNVLADWHVSIQVSPAFNDAVKTDMEPALSSKWRQNPAKSQLTVRLKLPISTILAYIYANVVVDISMVRRRKIYWRQNIFSEHQPVELGNYQHTNSGVHERSAGAGQLTGILNTW